MEHPGLAPVNSASRRGGRPSGGTCRGCRCGGTQQSAGLGRTQRCAAEDRDSLSCSRVQPAQIWRDPAGERLLGAGGALGLQRRCSIRGTREDRSPRPPPPRGHSRTGHPTHHLPGDTRGQARPSAQACRNLLTHPQGPREDIRLRLRAKVKVTGNSRATLLNSSLKSALTTRHVRAAMRSWFTSRAEINKGETDSDSQRKLQHGGSSKENQQRELNRLHGHKQQPSRENYITVPTKKIKDLTRSRLTVGHQKG